MEDLRLLERTLEAVGLAALARGRLRDCRRRAEVFGFHVASLDLRQHSAVHERIVDELLARGGLDGYSAREEPERVAILSRVLGRDDLALRDRSGLSAEARDLLATLEAVGWARRDMGPAACERYVVSFTRSPSDLLEVLVLALAAALAPGELRPVPLLEQLEDLEAAGPLAEAALALEPFRAAVRGELEVMLGYSDSGKQAGYVSSNVALHRAQRALAKVASDRGHVLTIFHGRGGAVGRGGGPANRAIFAQPPEALGGRFRVTEQGETIAARFGRPEIAARELEQILGAEIVTSALPYPVATHNVKVVTIPLPVIATSPNEGVTTGALTAFLVHNARDEVTSLVAPQVNYNPNFGTTFSLYGVFYPSVSRSVEVNLSHSTRVNDDYEARLRDVTLFNGKLENNLFIYHFADGSSRFFGLGPGSAVSSETNFAAVENGFTYTAAYPLLGDIALQLGERLLNQARKNQFTLEDFLSQLREAHGFGNSITSDLELLCSAFPRLRFVRIVRRHKLRQALSTARALQTGLWKVQEGKNVQREPEFDPDLIEQSLREAERQDKLWDDFFRQIGIKPFEVQYEKLCQNYETTIRAVLNFLKIKLPAGAQVGPPVTTRQADEISRIWARGQLTKTFGQPK